MACNSNLKKHKLIPIFVVENHDEVLPFIYRNIGARYLPVKNNVIIHFDSHPDLSIPRSMPASTAHDKYELFDNISIESWILPAAFSGYIKHILWMKPHWANQIPEGQYKFVIGENNKGTISVNSTLDYFVAEGVYDSEFIGETKDIELDVFTMGDNVAITDIPKYEDTAYILDIDLDYFSTYNPFKIMYSKGDVYEKLQEIFVYNKPKSSLPTDILKTVAERNILLDELEKLFQHLENHRNLDTWSHESSNYKKVLEFKDYVLKYYEDADIDWAIMFNAGCTWDVPEFVLPHHETSNSELNETYGIFEKFLMSLPLPPAIITISRSSEDDYCPKHQVDQIQCAVLNVLKKTFFVDEPILEYCNKD